MIRVNEVHKAFGSLQVLRGVSLDIHDGEVVSLIGPSGSGKSSLLLCINGLEPIDQGHIFVNDVDVHASETDLNRLRRGIGIVFQQYNAFPHLTVGQNVELGLLKVLKLPKKEVREKAQFHLEKVGLADKYTVLPGKLSGGQQQRLAIARALAMDPQYMLFDEVTSALDPELVGDVLDTLRTLADAGMTMLIVTHELQFARDVSDRVAFFDNGNIVHTAPPEEMFNNPVTERMRTFFERLH